MPITYRGWQNCFLLSNGLVEAVAVPSIGRVMQFRRVGEDSGAFWENPALYGQLHNATTKEWLNFGGDKCWPAPQSAFPAQMGRPWPPPLAFDPGPSEAQASAIGLVLTSPIDSDYGIQLVRRIELDAERPVLRIRSEFHKLTGEVTRASVWIITQMPEPEQVFLLLRAQSHLAEGFTRLLPGEPAGLKIDGRLLSLRRSPSAYVKIGSDASSMVWVGARDVVRIDAEDGPGEYPDRGSMTEIYTNPDPLHYVELETLSPLETLGVGECMTRTTTYTLTAREDQSPEAEARRALAL